MVPGTQRDRLRLLIDDAPGGLAGQLRIVRDLGERWRVQGQRRAGGLGLLVAIRLGCLPERGPLGQEQGEDGDPREMMMTKTTATASKVIGAMGSLGAAVAALR